MNSHYKRTLDIAVIIISHCLPPLPLLWLLIWTIVPIAIWLQDRGPIFYTQKRIPELHKEFVKQIPDFGLRLQVTPGLTGLAQIRGAYNLAPEEKLSYDLEYIEKTHFLLDIKIIILSIWYTITGKWGHPN